MISRHVVKSPLCSPCARNQGDGLENAHVRVLLEQNRRGLGLGRMFAPRRTFLKLSKRGQCRFYSRENIVTLEKIERLMIIRRIIRSIMWLIEDKRRWTIRSNYKKNFILMMVKTHLSPFTQAQLEGFIGLSMFVTCTKPLAKAMVLCTRFCTFFFYGILNMRRWYTKFKALSSSFSGKIIASY